MNLAGKRLLNLVLVFLALWFTGCKSNDDGIANHVTNTPVVVRGYYSYVFSLGADDATMEVRDTTRWYPHVAYLSISVWSYSGGSGILEIADSAGTRVCIDSIRGNTEILNRRIASSMPLRLRFSLQGFSGAVTFGLQLGPADIGGLAERFVLQDSTGLVRSSFKHGERVDFLYALVNLTGQPVRWSKGDSRPKCRFAVYRADSLLRDSFQGLAFLAVPESGTLQPGDSIRVLWHGIDSQSPLPLGHYNASAEPQFVPSDLGFLRDRESGFDIDP